MKNRLGSNCVLNSQDQCGKIYRSFFIILDELTEIPWNHFTFPVSTEIYMYFWKIFREINLVKDADAQYCSVEIAKNYRCIVQLRINFVNSTYWLLNCNACRFHEIFFSRESKFPITTATCEWDVFSMY